MPIEFSCTACGQLVRTPDSAAGKKGKCPHCGTIAQIPLANPPAAVTGLTPLASATPKPKAVASQGLGSRGSGVGSPQQAAAVISFPCGSCGQTVRTPMSAAGKKGKCPHCQAVVQIPGGAAPAAAAPAATAGLTPLAPLPSQQPKPAAKPTQTGPWKGSPAPAKPSKQPAAPAEEIEELPTLTPLDAAPGLTPLGPAPAGGLTPFGPAQPVGSFSAPAGGLTPLGPTGGLVPLGADPFGGLGGGDPLAGLTPMNTSSHLLGPAAVPNLYGPSPTGFSSPASNPYASPAGGGYSSGYDQGVSDAGRKGLPWERSADMESFQDTAMLVLSEPTNAFMQMRRSGGVMNSMAFWIVSLIIGNIVIILELAILAAILMAVGGAPPEAYGGLALGAAIYMVAGVMQAVILGPVGALVGAAIFHVVLLMFGCAKGGFEATFRALCFTAGAVALLNIIPVVGWIIGPFYQIALLIHAFTHAHEVSGGRVTAAVLTLYGLICCCLTPLFVFPLLPILSRLAAGGPL